MTRAHFDAKPSLSLEEMKRPESAPPAPDRQTPSSPTSSVDKMRNLVPAAARLVAGLFVGCFTRRETDNSKSYDHSVEFKPYSVAGKQGRGGETGTMRFTMDEIYKATKNFSASCIIGQGGFGTVYKGTLKDGTLIAIKRANKKSLGDDHSGVEFQSEIQTLAQVEHLNLVKFYGYLEHGDERVVVIEYVPNGTLRDHLDCRRGSILGFAQRLDIAIDVAHAITYLHMYTDHPIIHRDIKSSNILIAENFRAKVTDFGFARPGADWDSGDTHVSTQVKGTVGYVDIEYVRTNQLTEKSDVYSFGVLLVELVTGRRPIEPKREFKERITPKWAVSKFIAGQTTSILDPKLEPSAANTLALEKIIEVAVKCIGPSRRKRPRMKVCAEILWGIRKEYKELLV